MIWTCRDCGEQHYHRRSWCSACGGVEIETQGEEEREDEHEHEHAEQAEN